MFVEASAGCWRAGLTEACRPARPVVDLELRLEPWRFPDWRDLSGSTSGWDATALVCVVELVDLVCVLLFEVGAALVSVLAALLGAAVRCIECWCCTSGVCDRLFHRLPPLLVAALMGALEFKLVDEPARLPPAPYTPAPKPTVEALAAEASCKLSAPRPNDAGLAGRVGPRLPESHPRSCAYPSRTCTMP